MKFEELYEEYLIKPSDLDRNTYLNKFIEVIEACFDRQPDIEAIVIRSSFLSQSCECADIKYAFKFKNKIYYDETFDDEPGLLFEDKAYEEAENGWKYDPDFIDHKVFNLITMCDIPRKLWLGEYILNIKRKNGKAIIIKESLPW